MVHLRRLLASALAAFSLLGALAGCSSHRAEKKALAEANALSSGYYHIEIVGQNGLATLAYQSDVLSIDDKTQWDGMATIGAYNMAFRQECHSVYSGEIKAKQWRGKWVQSDATSPSHQLQSWIQSSKGQYNGTPVAASSVLPLEQADDRQVVSIHISKASIDWWAVCDAHIDSYFGSQAFLTDVKSVSVTLYFDADTLLFLGAKFTGEKDSTKISGSIAMSATDGQALSEFPEKDTVSEGTLAEEWSIVRS